MGWPQARMGAIGRSPSGIQGLSLVTPGGTMYSHDRSPGLLFMRRQADGKFRSAVRVVPGAHAAAKAFHDRVADGQAEPGAFPDLLGREEGVEYLPEPFFRNAAAIVAQDDQRSAVLAFPGTHGHGATLAHSVDGIVQHVENHLLQLPDIGGNAKFPVREVALDGDAAERGFVLQKGDGLIHDWVEGQAFRGGVDAPGKAEQPVMSLARSTFCSTLIAAFCISA